ncbi:hypothetical protein JCM10212_003358, partial [Sporobolomyces blumeae]
MLYSSVRHVDEYSQSLASRFGTDSSGCARIPTIREWQDVIESAWRSGYDPPGRDYFNGKLVGSRRWIGTTEAYVALTFLGIRVKIVDFKKVKAKDGEGSHTALV